MPAQGRKPLTTELLDSLSEQFGSAFYLLESKTFEENCRELTDAFRVYYPDTSIAYSYKTNYTPKLVKIVNRMGGYSEIVSDMEMQIALKAGVSPERIIWNGPVKNIGKLKEFLFSGGTVNIDSLTEIEAVRKIAEAFPERSLRVGVRCNYDVGDGVFSRFGLDVSGAEFHSVLRFIADTPNVTLTQFHAHFARRMPVFWTARTEGMLKLYDLALEKYGLRPECLDLGGGMFGKMPESLASQLGIGAIRYDDYASRSAKLFAARFQNADNAPRLLVEPGSAVAGDCMRFVCKIESLKTVRGKTIATALGSQKNISMSGLNPPMWVIPSAQSRERRQYQNADIAGYTCIESDYLYRGYSGSLAVGDYIVFGNCGSYSIVMKPPFILPNFPVLDICGQAEGMEVIKRAESFDDVMGTFYF